MYRLWRPWLVGRRRASLGEDADALVSAAWLHDVGYAPEVFLS
jgi:hypothetical protein